MVVLSGYSVSGNIGRDVIISARDANNCIWWDTILPRLSQLMQAKGLQVDVVLLYLQDLEITMTSSFDSLSRPHSSIRDEFCRPYLFMGTSIALSGSRGSGTLGSSIKLNKGGSTLELGLTNYHVVKDAFSNHSNAYPPGVGPPYKPVISPSDNDYESAIEHMDGILQRLEYCKEKHKAAGIEDP
jgi:hypothetical protein